MKTTVHASRWHERRSESINEESRECVARQLLPAPRALCYEAGGRHCPLLPMNNLCTLSPAD